LEANALLGPYLPHHDEGSDWYDASHRQAQEVLPMDGDSECEPRGEYGRKEVHEAQVQQPDKSFHTPAKTTVKGANALVAEARKVEAQQMCRQGHAYVSLDARGTAVN
jgi:hypothetical protein